MKFSFWNILLSIIVAFALFLGFTVVRYAINQPKGDVAVETPSDDGDVLGEQAQRKDVTIEKVADFVRKEIQKGTFPGKVESAFESKLVAPMTGTIKALNAKVGQNVSKGNVLVDIAGNASNDTTAIEKANTDEMIKKKQNELDILRSNLETQYTLVTQNAGAAVRDLQNQQVILKSNHLAEMDGLEKQNIYLQAQMVQVREQMALIENNGYNGDLDYSNYNYDWNRVQDDAEEIVVDLKNTIEDSALPLARILEDEEEDYDRLREDAEEQIDTMEEWESNAQDINNASELEDFVDDVYNTFHLFDRLSLGIIDVNLSSNDEDDAEDYENDMRNDQDDIQSNMNYIEQDQYTSSHSSSNYTVQYDYDYDYDWDQIQAEIRSISKSFIDNIEDNVLPIAQILEDEDTDYADLVSDLENQIDTFEEWKDEAKDVNKKSELDDFLDSVEDALDLFHDVRAGIDDVNLSGSDEDDVEEYEDDMNSEENDIEANIDYLQEDHQIVVQTTNSGVSVANNSQPLPPISVRIANGPLEQQMLGLLKAKQKMSDDKSLKEQAFNQRNQELHAQINAKWGEENAARWELDNIRIFRNSDMLGLSNEIDALKKKRDELGKEIAGVKIEAPFSGTVTEVLVSSGSKITNNAPLLTLASSDKTTVAFVDQANIEKVKAGNMVDVSIGGKKKYTTKVQSIAGPSLSQAGTIEVILENVKDLAADSTFEISMPGESTEQIFIPSSAVMSDKDGSFVLVYDEKTDSVFKSPVVLGERDGASVEIKQGLFANQEIITKGAEKLQPGDKLSEAKPETPSTVTALDPNAAPTESPQKDVLYIMTPLSDTLTVGQESQITLFLLPQGEGIIAGQTYISFDPDFIEVTSVNTQGSIFRSWVDQSITDKEVHLSFGNTGQIEKVAKGKVAALNIKAKKKGNTTLKFNTDQTITSLGSGKNVLQKEKLEDLKIEVK